MQHGGNIYQFAQRFGCLPEEILDFSANINPKQAVDWRTLTNINLGPYSEPEYDTLKHAIKLRYPLAKNADLEVFNGASAAIFALLRWLDPDQVVMYAPLYIEYASIAKQIGCNINYINRFTETHTNVPKGSTIIFVNPSTPDGKWYEVTELLLHWQSLQCNIIIDESFLDFCTEDSSVRFIAEMDNLYIIKSLSKFYGCAGIRIGFIVAATKSIAGLKQLEPAWKLSTLDMAYMQQALSHTEFIPQTQLQTAQLRALLYQVLLSSDLFAEIYPSRANFLLARLKDNLDGYRLQTLLSNAKILIRVCDNFIGLNQYYVRFAVKDEQAILLLDTALQGIHVF